MLNLENTNYHLDSVNNIKIAAQDQSNNQATRAAAAVGSIGLAGNAAYQANRAHTELKNLRDAMLDAKINHRYNRNSSIPEVRRSARLDRKELHELHKSYRSIRKNPFKLTGVKGAVASLAGSAGLAYAARNYTGVSEKTASIDTFAYLASVKGIAIEKLANTNLPSTNVNSTSTTSGTTKAKPKAWYKNKMVRRFGPAIAAGGTAGALAGMAFGGNSKKD